MKLLLLTLPMAFCATVALAQTDTTSGAGGERFGTSWPDTIGSTFFMDKGKASLRSDADLTSGWQALSQADRDTIMTDCKAFNAAHGDAHEGDPGTMAADGPGYDMTQMRAICGAVGKF